MTRHICDVCRQDVQVYRITEINFTPIIFDTSARQLEPDKDRYLKGRPRRFILCDSCVRNFINLFGIPEA